MVRERRTPAGIQDHRGQRRGALKRYSRDEVISVSPPPSGPPMGVIIASCTWLQSTYTLVVNPCDHLFNVGLSPHCELQGGRDHTTLCPQRQAQCLAHSGVGSLSMCCLLQESSRPHTLPLP